MDGALDGLQITDLSSLSAENFKERNTKFLEGDTEYDVLDHQSQQELRRQIWNVRNGDLRRVLDDFPREAPLHEQCAGWMHAIAGKHFFPDANHRTAMALLRRLLRQNDIPQDTWPVDVTYQTTIRSHRVRREIEPVHLDTLYRQDRLFLVWLLYFKTVLRNVDR
jgi:prophage maintenance system killer protein